MLTVKKLEKPLKMSSELQSGFIQGSGDPQVLLLWFTSLAQSRKIAAKHELVVNGNHFVLACLCQKVWYSAWL